MLQAIPFIGATPLHQPGNTAALWGSKKHIRLKVLTDNSNNILSKNNIQVYTPATPTLTDNAIASTICSGDDITFTIQPYSATATYTFYLNGAIEQQLSGVNSITYSSIGANAISDGDIITIGMIDSNGCTTDTSTISTTVTVEAILQPH